ncbi:MAG: hypothetical protein AB7S38_25210 [Vulcanimicrobiota bacterium]
MRAPFCLLLVLYLLLPGLAWAQDAEFTLETTEFRVKDNFERPYLVENGKAWVAVRLLTGDDQQAKLDAYEVLSSSGVEYPTKGDPIEPLLFPISDGVAKVQFVVFSDAGRNPISYSLKLVEEEEGKKYESPFLEGAWMAGNQTPSEELQTDRLAPHANWEWMAIVAFALCAAILIYLWFGRSLFGRMLFNRQMTVSSAEAASNMLVLIGWLSLAVVVPLLYFFPYVVWQQQYYIYLLVAGGYILLVGLGYSLGLMMTKR